MGSGLICPIIEDQWERSEGLRYATLRWGFPKKSMVTGGGVGNSNSPTIVVDVVESFAVHPVVGLQILCMTEVSGMLLVL